MPRNYRKWDNNEVVKVKDLVINQGLTFRQAAKILGRTRNSVSHFFKRNGIKTGRRGGYPMKPVCPRCGRNRFDRI